MKIRFFHPIKLSIRLLGDFDPLISMEGVPNPNSGKKLGNFWKNVNFKNHVFSRVDFL